MKVVDRGSTSAKKKDMGLGSIAGVKEGRANDPKDGPIADLVEKKGVDGPSPREDGADGPIDQTIVAKSLTVMEGILPQFVITDAEKDIMKARRGEREQEVGYRREN